LLPLGQNSLGLHRHACPSDQGWVLPLTLNMQLTSLIFSPQMFTLALVSVSEPHATHSRWGTQNLLMGPGSSYAKGKRAVPSLLSLYPFPQTRGWAPLPDRTSPSPQVRLPSLPRTPEDGVYVCRVTASRKLASSATLNCAFTLRLE